MTIRPGDELSMVVINWVANPFRGDKFEAAWAPAAEAATKFGAHAWAFTRSKDDPLHFMQIAVFDNKIDFERYWYSEETAEARIKCAGLYQVPLLPVWWRSIGFGAVSDTIEQPSAA
ncbi:MAG: hypothetical protein ACJ76Z_00555 [Thermoleophilaceae bacterium]